MDPCGSRATAPSGTARRLSNSAAKERRGPAEPSAPRNSADMPPGPLDHVRRRDGRWVGRAGALTPLRDRDAIPVDQHSLNRYPMP